MKATRKRLGEQPRFFRVDFLSGADAGTIDTKPEESNAEEQTLFPIDKRE